MRNLSRETRDVRDTAIGFSSLPVREQVLDRLADVMLDADDILDALASDAAGELRLLGPEVEELFDRANRLMERLSD